MAKTNFIQSSLLNTGEAVKRCRKCNQKKPVDQFYPAKHKRASRDGIQAYCKPCALMSFRSHHLKVQYDITHDQYREMLAEQMGLCAICGKPEIASTNASDRIRSLAIDHDHASGKVRALLCTKCNTGLGAFEDSPDLLQKAIDYILSHSCAAVDCSLADADADNNSI